MTTAKPTLGEASLCWLIRDKVLLLLAENWFWAWQNMTMGIQQRQ